MGNFSDWAKPELIWFLIGLALLLLEFTLPGFIIFFFGVGAWMVAVLCLFTDVSLNAQLGIFLVVSVLLLISLRKWVKTVFIGRITLKQNLDEKFEDFVGKKAVVSKRITPGSQGRVEFHGSNWNAESDEIILEGTTVEIIKKNNITFKVKSINKE